jgi:hypothetical protein
MTAANYARLAFAAVAFIVAAMAMVILIWRDSRPRPDDFTSIVRNPRRPTPQPIHHHTHYCRRIGCREEANDASND